MILFNRSMSALLLAALVLLTAPVGYAQDEEKSAATADDEKATADETADEQPDADEEELFPLPENASIEELGEFLDGLRTKRPRGQEEVVALFRSVLKATDLILAGEPDGKLAMNAVQARLAALSNLARSDDDFEGPTVAEFLESLKTHESPALAKIGQVIAFSQKARGIRTMDADERDQFVQEAITFVKDAGLDGQTFSILQSVATGVEYSDAPPEVAASTYEQVADLGKGSDDEAIQAAVVKLEGAARRLRLPGNEILVQGTTMDGEQLDWDSYRGKIVLIDFWATWCGPCVREVPNMKQNYADYNDKGFEIVGINLDQNVAAFENFVESRELPWAQVVDKGAENSVADYYGIIGIPTQILVDREGKVISLSARGKELDARLEELLGPRPTKEEEKTEDAAEASDSSEE